MFQTFPEVRIGDPIRYRNLTVFPLFATGPGAVDYVLSDEALAAGLAAVREVDERGAVSELEVTNNSGSPVLFLEGEELQGAKQNRVLNTTVLVAAHSRSTIPVSCVESGRWEYRSRHFGSSGLHVSPRMKRELKASVSSSLRAKRGHRSDQRAVWAEVARQQVALGACSDTEAMADTYEARRESIDDFSERLQYAEGSNGVAVAIGGRVVAIDLFDRPETCRKVWRRLLSGMVMDALEQPPAEASIGAGEVTRDLTMVREAEWSRVDAVGLGEELRSSGRRFVGSSLVVDGVPVHVSAVAVS